MIFGVRKSLEPDRIFLHWATFSNSSSSIVDRRKPATSSGVDVSRRNCIRAHFVESSARRGDQTDRGRGRGRERKREKERESGRQREREREREREEKERYFMHASRYTTNERELDMAD
jgi:hypothetical protein